MSIVKVTTVEGDSYEVGKNNIEFIYQDNENHYYHIQTKCNRDVMVYFNIVGTVIINNS